MIQSLPANRCLLSPVRARSAYALEPITGSAYALEPITPLLINLKKVRTPFLWLQAKKTVTFVDLGGHGKYLKTTYAGLMGHSPHHVALVVAATSGLVGTGPCPLNRTALRIMIKYRR